jgi:hypothetical protein
MSSPAIDPRTSSRVAPHRRPSSCSATKTAAPAAITPATRFMIRLPHRTTRGFVRRLGYLREHARSCADSITNRPSGTPTSSAVWYRAHRGRRPMKAVSASLTFPLRRTTCAPAPKGIQNRSAAPDASAEVMSAVYGVSTLRLPLGAIMAGLPFAHESTSRRPLGRGQRGARTEKRPGGYYRSASPSIAARRV